MPRNKAIVRATGSTTVPDPTLTPGLLQLMARKEEDGSFNMFMWMGWDTKFSYVERGFGSVIEHPSLHGLSTHDMMHGEASTDIETLTEALLSASYKKQSDISGGSLTNVARLVDLGKAMVNSLEKFMELDVPAQGNFKVLDMPLETWLKFIIKLKTRYRKLIKHSISNDSFAFAPIGLKVGKYKVSTETKYDDGSRNPPRWIYDMPDNTLEEQKYRRAMVGIWFILRGIFNEPISDYDSIFLSVMFEKFRRQPMALESTSLSQLVYHLMPQVLRPGLMDLSTKRSMAKCVAYLIMMTMMVNLCTEVGLSTLVSPVHWTAVKTGAQPDIELLQTWNYGRFRPEPEFGSGECTFIKPSRGRVTGFSMMRNSGVNEIPMKLKRNPRKINSSPTIQYSDDLVLATDPGMDELNVLGFAFRGTIVHLFSDDESSDRSLLRIVDSTLRPGDEGHDAGVTEHGVLANLLIGAVPLFKNTTGTIVGTVLIGDDGDEFAMEYVEDQVSTDVDRDPSDEIIPESEVPGTEEE